MIILISIFHKYLILFYTIAGPSLYQVNGKMNIVDKKLFAKAKLGGSLETRANFRYANLTSYTDVEYENLRRGRRVCMRNATNSTLTKKKTHTENKINKNIADSIKKRQRQLEPKLEHLLQIGCQLATAMLFGKFIDYIECKDLVDHNNVVLKKEDQNKPIWSQSQIMRVASQCTVIQYVVAEKREALETEKKIMKEWIEAGPGDTDRNAIYFTAKEQFHQTHSVPQLVERALTKITETLPSSTKEKFDKMAWKKLDIFTKDMLVKTKVFISYLWSVVYMSLACKDHKIRRLNSCVSNNINLFWILN